MEWYKCVYRDIFGHLYYKFTINGSSKCYKYNDRRNKFEYCKIDIVDTFGKTNVLTLLYDYYSKSNFTTTPRVRSGSMTTTYERIELGTIGNLPGDKKFSVEESSNKTSKSSYEIIRILTYLGDWGIKVKVKDYKESARIFGFKSNKQRLVGKKFNFSDLKISKSIVIKKDYTDYSIQVPSDTGKYLSFCISDIEPDFPDFSKIKDIKLSLGSNIKCIRNKKYNNIKIGETVVFTNIIKKDPHLNNPQIIEVVNKSGNKIKVYRKDFKIL